MGDMSFLKTTNTDDLQQMCGMDLLCDEAIIFERIKTNIDIYPGVPHGFRTVFPTMNLSKKFVQDTVKGVAWLIALAKT